MPDAFLGLSVDDQREVLELASQRTGRPAHLLEKDVWVVWVLQTLFGDRFGDESGTATHPPSPLAAHLTFKGGTSLSKAYRIIDRFSEDIDLTYDIRRLIPDLVDAATALPGSRSQADRWTKAVRTRLPQWIDHDVRPLLQQAIDQQRLSVRLEQAGTEQDKLLLHYPAQRLGTGYVAPVVTMEFGARATGEPHQVMQVTCDMAGQVDGVTFPQASPQVMTVARTFWEKATAAHVYCAQARIRGERYARHWHDLAAIARSEHFDAVLADRDVARAVAEHKSRFFIERDADGRTIDYFAATGGQLAIEPVGLARDALQADYALMVADDVMVGHALTFEDLMAACASIAARANAAA